jgi:HSP20 family protein
MNDKLKDSLGDAWQSVSESLAHGWRELRDSASSALTRFRGKDSAEDDASLPDDVPTPGWGFMAADLLDDDDRIVVRLEAPGMKRDEFQIDVLDQRLVVQGHKRFRRESSQGAYRMLQCAYGSFHRELPLPAAVQAGKATATYRDGVLRVELPKDESARRRRIAVQVH